jgi:hypothetical protein
MQLGTENKVAPRILEISNKPFKRHLIEKYFEFV